MSIRIWSLPIVFLLGCGLLACNSAMAQTSNGRNTEEPVSAVDAIENPTSLSLDEEPMTEVKVEGNTTIPKSDIAKHIRTRPGRVVTAQQIKDDVDALVRTRWFVTVEPSIRRTDSGNMLVFKVVERPIILKVVYKGNKKIKTKEFDRITQLKPGQPYDVSANKECARRIEQLYREKGFAFATIELQQGGGDDPECQVVFQINEGPKVNVTSIQFEGNNNPSDQIDSDTSLKTHDQSKAR